MRKILCLFLFSILWIYPCPASEAGDAESPKFLVVCTLFPQYDFARNIAGDKASVIMLLPPGTESHTFDPRPGDILSLNRADLFIYTGKEMEPWAERILGSLDNKSLIAVDASAGAVLRKEEHERGHHEEGHRHEHDPHIWLDPILAATMVENIKEGFCLLDPQNAPFYEQNAKEYKERLFLLDRDLREAVRDGKRDVLFFGGRFAYLYFFERYGLRYVSAYENCSTEGEPGIRRVAEVIRAMRREDARFIFHEEFSDPKVARSIAEQTGAGLLLFRTAHNVTRDEFEKGTGFIDIMRANLENIRKGLE